VHLLFWGIGNLGSDWDANQIPVLADLEIGGRPRKVLAWANRNAFY